MSAKLLGGELVSLYDNELSERKRSILKAIVETHIECGEPVGSKSIMQCKQIACSSATIRNEMAELEELGYLEQPHTSAGRVPSEMGYRFYVDSLIKNYASTAHDIAEINTLLKVKLTELDQILSLASKVASNLTNYTGMSLKPKTLLVSITRFETIFIDQNNFILVMLTSTGMVKSKYLRTSETIDSDITNHLSEVLNGLLSGLSADKISLPIIMHLEEEMHNNSYLISQTIKCIYDVMNELDGGELNFSGINRLLQYPEYAEKEQLSELIQALESKDEIIDLVSEKQGDEINVVIGSESSVKVMNQSAIVYKTIKKDGKTLGVIGVIGPRRMDYAKVLATLESISDNINNLLEENKLLNKGEEHGENSE